MKCKYGVTVSLSLVLMMASTLTFGQARMRRNIYRLGLNQGLCKALMFQAGITDTTRGSLRVWHDRAIIALRDIIEDFRAPFSSEGLKNVLGRMERFDPTTSSGNDEQKSKFYATMRQAAHPSFASTYGLETEGRTTMETTCESSLLRLGYYFGKLWVFTIRGNDPARRETVSNLKQVLINARGAVKNLNCAFMDFGVLDRLRMFDARTNEEFRRIRDGLDDAIFSFRPNDPLNNTPSQRAKKQKKMSKFNPVGIWGYKDYQFGWQDSYKITKEGNHFVVREIRHQKIYPFTEWERHEGLRIINHCWDDETIRYKFNIYQEHDATVNRSVYKGSYCSEDYESRYRHYERTKTKLGIFKKFYAIMWFEGPDKIYLKYTNYNSTKKKYGWAAKIGRIRKKK